jgi:DNA-binding CsgD family transcriptional regulator/NAD(P)-dependent dehydrogenase (short-subunit alcohol dehydrogenase family)
MVLGENIMSRDEASARQHHDDDKARSYAHERNVRQQSVRKQEAQARGAEALRPRTVLVITGTGQARETGLYCVNMLANAGHRVVAVLADGNAPEEFIKGPVADRIACVNKGAGTDSMLRNAIAALPDRFRQIDTLVSMICIQSCHNPLLEKEARPVNVDPAAGIGDLVDAVRAVLPELSASRRSHALAVLLPETGVRHARVKPSLHHEQAELLIATLRAELTELGVRFTRIQSGALEASGELTPKDVTQAVAWALGQPHHLAVCDIDIQPAPLARPALTRREREVLAWTACGKTSDEISRILDLSVSGVNFHVTNFLSKLDTCNKMAAVARATQLGLLP